MDINRKRASTKFMWEFVNLNPDAAEEFSVQRKLSAFDNMVLGHLESEESENVNDDEENKLSETLVQNRPQSTYNYSLNHHSEIDITLSSLLNEAWMELKRTHILVKVLRWILSFITPTCRDSDDNSSEIPSENVSERGTSLSSHFSELKRNKTSHNFSTKQDVILSFTRYITLFFLACLLLEDDLFYEKWENSFESSEGIFTALFDNFFKLFFTVLLSVPILEALNRLFLRLNALNDAKKNYLEVILRERIEIMNCDLELMSLRDIMIVLYKITSLLHFWDLTVQDILSNEGETAFEVAKRECLEPVRKRKEFIQEISENKRGDWIFRLFYLHK